MAISVLRLLGERVAHKTLTEHSHTGGFLDIKLGFAMLKDKRVPVKPKLLAVGIGAAVIALLVAVEFPLEALLAAVVPVLGPLGDLLTDGFEALLGTVGIAAILLPHVAPKLLVRQLRNERDGIIEAVLSEPVAESLHANYDLSQPTQKMISS